MASKYWIKLYHEILDDPKMGKLSDRLWRRAIELFLLAGDEGDEGNLPLPADIAWRLRIPEKELIQDLAALSADGIEIIEYLTWTEDWLVTKFADRQGPVSDIERKRQSRDKSRKEEYYGHEDVTSRDENVTIDLDTNPHADLSTNTQLSRNSHEDVTSRETDTDTDTESETDKKQTTDKEAEKEKNAAVAVLLSDFGVEEPWLSDLASKCSEDHVKDWIAYVNGRDGINNPTGFLISRLRVGESPPPWVEKSGRWFTGDDFKQYFVQPGELPEEESNADD